MENDASNSQIEEPINNITTMMETMDLFTHMLNQPSNPRPVIPSLPPALRRTFEMGRRNLRQSPIENIFNISNSRYINADTSNNNIRDTAHDMLESEHLDTVVRNIIDNSSNSIEESSDFDSYVRFIEDILQLPPLTTELPSELSTELPPLSSGLSPLSPGLPSRDHIRALLLETLNEKPIYKQVLSEEGEANIKIVTYNPEIHVDIKCCPITQIDFSINDKISQLPCSHLFDSNAILKWLKDEKAECPICRFKMKSYEKKLEPKSPGFTDISENRNLIRENIRFRHPFGPRSSRSPNYLNFRRLMLSRQSYEEEEELQAVLLASLEQQYMPNASTHHADADADIDSDVDSDVD